jgi:hypothetical protein
MPARDAIVAARRPSVQPQIPDRDLCFPPGGLLPLGASAAWRFGVRLGAVSPGASRARSGQPRRAVPATVPDVVLNCSCPVPRLPCRAGALALVLAIGLSVAACGPQDRTAAGVVIAVDAPAGQVNGFTLRTTDGQVISFVIGTLETDAGAFPAFHLAAHAATLQPIAVAYRVEDGRNVVYRMADAPWAQPS